MSLGLSNRIVLATRNPGKLREVQAILGNLAIEWRTLLDYPDVEVVESGSTMRENAILKATAVAHATGLWALADDSGLEVDPLNGDPGVHSSRFLGEKASDEDKYREILRRLEGVREDARTARFRCVVALASPEKLVNVAEATWEGRIALDPRGSSGFGYDPIFVIPDLHCTAAELTPEQKNALSHRGQALRRAFLCNE